MQPELTEIPPKDERILFVHDSSQVQSEEDDPFAAIVHFEASNPWTNDDKCWLCGSLVTLYDSVPKVGGSNLRNVVLRTMVFALKRVDSYVTFGLGCPVDQSPPEKVTLQLQTLLDVINFRYAPVSMVTTHYDDVAKRGLLQFLEKAENTREIKLELETQLISSIFLGNVTKQYLAIGACLIFQDRVVRSTLHQSLTEIVVAAKTFLKNQRTESEQPEIFSAQSPANVASRHIHSLNVKHEKKNIDKKHAEGSLAVTFLSFRFRQVELLLLQQENNFNEKALLSLKQQLSFLSERISRATGTWVEFENVTMNWMWQEDSPSSQPAHFIRSCLSAESLNIKTTTCLRPRFQISENCI